MRNLAILCKSLSDIPYSYLEGNYRDFIPEKIKDLIPKSISIKNHNFEKAIDQKDFPSICKYISSARSLIKEDKSDFCYSYKYNRYNTQANQKIYNTEPFDFLWNKVVTSDLHIDMLKFIMKDPQNKYLLKKNVKINKLFVNGIIKNDKVTREFIDFITTEEWSKVFNVPSKELIIKFLNKKNRKDDMYLFLNTGSKQINNLIIRRASKKDLPFLMGANGISAKKSLEKKFDE